LAALRALSVGARLDAFYRGWTRKEAYLKATGLGLALVDEQVEVPLAASPSPAPLRAPGAASAGGWWLYDLSPAPGFVGALVVDGHAARLGRWEWPAR
jgi:4'-phosphopantetheinyl transferase